jgi:transposase
VIEGPNGRRRRTRSERARIAAESMMPAAKVADVARKHGTTRWQIDDWRKQSRKGRLALPESVAALPIFAELAVDDTATAAPPTVTRSDLEIVVGDIVIRVGADADAGHLTRAIRAARAAASGCSATAGR